MFSLGNAILHGLFAQPRRHFVGTVMLIDSDSLDLSNVSMAGTRIPYRTARCEYF
jgi:hypothetical protein